MSIYTDDTISAATPSRWSKRKGTVDAMDKPVVEVSPAEEGIVDAVWGRVDDKSGPNYRNLGWCATHLHLETLC